MHIFSWNVCQNPLICKVQKYENYERKSIHSVFKQIENHTPYFRHGNVINNVSYVNEFLL